MSNFHIISAKEAYDLVDDRSLEKTLKQLDSRIRAAVTEGNTSIRIPYDMCKTVSEYELELRSKRLTTVLLEAGYRLVSKYEDGGFSDVWLELSWEPSRTTERVK